MADSERITSLLLENMPTVVWQLDGVGAIVRASPSHARQLGLDPRQAEGPLAAMVHPDDLAAIETALDEAAREGSAALRLRARHAQRDWVSCQLRIFPLPADDEGPGSLCFLRPTEGAEDDLFRVLAQNIPGTVYLCRNDETYSMLFLNQEVQRLTGHPPDEFLAGAVDFVQLYHPDDASQIGVEVEAALAARRPFELRYRLRHRDGSYRHVREHGQGIWSASGELAMLEGTLFDVTEEAEAQAHRAAVEARLQQAQKLESLGLLAGGIAHDFNNFLLAIVGNIELARMSSSLDRDARRCLEDASTAADQAARLTRQMLSYAGRSPTEAVRFDLRRIVDDTLSIIGPSKRLRVHCLHEAATEPLPVHGDAAQVQQVVMNLVINATEALPGSGGRVWVRSASVTTDGVVPHLVAPADGAEPGTYAMLEVEDDGPGIDEENLQRIFDPFFSTKAEGHGLGLSAVLGTIRGHHGMLALTTGPMGTTFRVYLPLADAPSDEAAPETAAPTILVVEDEDAVRRVLELVLRREGFRVVTARDGREALGTLNRESEFSALVLDLNMPELDGHGVLAALEAKGIRIPTLVISGFHPHGAPARRHDVPSLFLAKPFRPHQLVAAIRQLLDGDV